MSNWQTEGYVPDSEGEDDEDILETQTEDVVELVAEKDSDSQLGSIAPVNDLHQQTTQQVATQADQNVVDLSIFDFPGDDTPVSTPVTKRKSGVGVNVTNSDNDQPETYRTPKKPKTQVELTSFDDGGEYASQAQEAAQRVMVQDPREMEVEQIELVRQWLCC